MLIVPLHGQLAWRRPPLVTLLLIAINLAVHALAAGERERSLERALDYYFASPLPALELPRYVDYIGGGAPADGLPLRKDREEALALLARMQADKPFMARLRAGLIVTPGDPEYAQWQAARARFEAMLGDTAIDRFGFVPAQHRPATFVTHMFLHGDWGHVIGNMALLFIVGFVVEAALGWWRVLLCYFLTGLGAVSVFWLSQPDSTVPLVGASGAVSGMVGVYAAMFGLRRINFFFFVWVYFDYVRAPALLLLLLWLANEAFQLMTDPLGEVAYAAHLGGLVCGALATWLALLARDPRLRAFRAGFDAEEASARSYRQALDLMAQFRFDEAVELMERIVALRPDDHEVQFQAFNVAKHVPESEAFHRIAERVFDLPTGNRAMLELVRDALREYLAKARPGPRIATAQVASLAARLADGGLVEEAEKMGTALVARRARGLEIRSAFEALAEAQARVGSADRAAYWREQSAARAKDR